MAEAIMTTTAHPSSGIVVVGGGPAAHRFVERLRHHGHHDPVTVLCAEPSPPYNRVLLTSVLAGALPPRAVVLPTLGGATDLRLRTTAMRIDRRRRLVHTDDGSVHPYRTLVLVTGSRPETPDELPRIDEVRTLRTLADCGTLPEGPVAILGAGVLGVETALALCRAGREVVLVHRRPYPMNRQLGPDAGCLLAMSLAGHGIDVRTNRRIVEYTPGKLMLDDGQVIQANTLLVCTGAAPDTRLARRAGLAVRRGVVVNARLRTSDPHIHALGDCAEPRGGSTGLLLSAWDQAELLARTLSGRPVSRRPAKAALRLNAPELDLAVYGSADAAATNSVTLSAPSSGRYARLLLRDDRIVGAVLLGLPRAMANVGLLYDRDLPVPSDRLALLLGRPATLGAGVVELPDEAIVCVCNGVTKADLARAWADGARELSELAAATRATTGCGGCAQAVRRACAVRPPDRNASERL
nr:FAD-dependent oxidoreductase [Streptomyces tailanensis]